MRYSLLMLLAFAVLAAHCYAARQDTSVLLALVASAAVASVAALTVKGEAGAQSTVWLSELLAATSLVVMVYAVGSGSTGLFYGMVTASAVVGLLLTRPRFTVSVEPVVNGAATGVVSFIVVLLLSVVTAWMWSLSAPTVLRASTLAVMEVDPLLMFFLVAVPEELWARAWLYSGLKKYAGARAAAFWSTLFFVALHIPSRIQMLSDNIRLLPVVIALIGIAMLPIVYIYARYCEHPLFSIAAHGTYNTLLSVVTASSMLNVIAMLMVLVAALAVLRLYGVRVVGRAA